MIVGRLAPSPTGAQHVGNARTYLLAWLAARSAGGRLILRVEDIDSPRVKSGAAQQAIDDLHWLGLDWDEGPDRPGKLGPYFQSERLDRYREALERLKRAGAVYPCDCSRSEVAAAASAPHADGEPPPYPGTCAGKSVADAAALGDRPYAWRLRTGSATSYSDLVKGVQSGSAAGDFVVAKKDGAPAYQLAVVVDDLAMGVTQVVRGDDLVPSTFRQLELYRRWNEAPPAFAHVPLVVGPDGRRLAKRHGDTRLATLRAAGVAPEALVGLLAWSCGLLPEVRPATPWELLSRFSFKMLKGGSFVLMDEHLRSIGAS